MQLINGLANAVKSRLFVKLALKRIERITMKKFLIIWFGELLSTIGSGLTAFGLGVYVYQKTGMATTLVSLLALLPAVLLGPFADVLADRWHQIRYDG